MPRLNSGANHAQAMCADCIGYAECFFHQLPSESRAVVQPLLTERVFSPGQVLLHQGQPAALLQVIKVGDVLAMRRTPNGQEHVVALLGRGQLMGLGGVWEDANPVTCQALSSGRVCEVPVRSLSQAMLLDARFLQLLGQVNLRAVNCLADWAMVSRLKTVDERIANVMCMLAQVQRSPQIRLPSHQVLASLVGSSREAVVRTLKQQEQDGRISRKERGRYEVHLKPCAYCKSTAQ